MGLRLVGRKGRLIAGGAVLALLTGAGAVTAVASDSPAPVTRTDQKLSMSGVKIDTSYFTTDGTTAADPKPAVLLGHGFGGSKNDSREQAEKLARSGYAVLTWSARGFGESTGKIGLNDPAREGKDVRALIDWLAERPEVRMDAKGDPRVGVAGVSYGGAAALQAAGYDKRVDAIAPVITYWDLADALFPDGVFKKLWSGIFFTTGSVMPQEDEGGEPGAGGVGGEPREEAQGADGSDGTAGDAPGTSGVKPAPGQGQDGCGRFVKQLCEMYERVAERGEPDEQARELLSQRSPAAVGDRIKVPTLVVQGKTDTLFPLEHADAMARTIAGNGAPVAVDWIAGGHDGGAMETDRVQQRITDWFDKHLAEKPGVDTGPAFRVSRGGGVDSTSGSVTQREATSNRYPGLGSGQREVRLTGEKQTFRNPPGGGPPSISAVPGIGGGLAQLGSVGSGLSMDFPGQHARFASKPFTENLTVTGSPTVRLRIDTERDAGEAAPRDAVLFGKLYDVGPDGRKVLPNGLVSPVRVGDVDDGATVALRLPAIDREIKAGHRLELVVAATDLGYASPPEAADYAVSLDGTTLKVPTAPQVTSAGIGLPWWVWGLPLIGAGVALLLLVTGRRRHKPATTAPQPGSADVPLEITGLTKRYAGAADRYAVRDLSFRVDQGQVLGLLGPNGAGKTTTLRMLMGLIKPDEGEIRLFGQVVRPGAPVLSRVGAFVEGAGFLPHLSGRANLELYWKATGRPAEDAHLEEALEIADLGEALHRAVRTYSQGMRQRLAIAQAMLGLPELLILDEPTNGLDPPQIREMREVMIRYARTGRTVIVSSHLLAEVEQSCTHLVVMDRGRLVRSGPVEEIAGAGDSLLVGVAGEQPSTQLDAWADKVAALRGVGAATPVQGGLLIRLDGTTAEVLLPELLRLGIPVERFGPHRRLEEAFLTMIGGQPV